MILNLKTINKEATALIDVDGNKFTYHDLIIFIESFYKQINKRTLLFHFAENSIPSVCGYVACLENKIVPLLLNVSTDEQLRTHLLNIYQPEYLWLPDEMITDFECELVYQFRGYSLLKTNFSTPDLNENLSLLLPTSGSTGSPKLVRHSYQNIIENAKNIGKVFEIKNTDKSIAMLPMYYTMGLSVITSYLFGGATVLLYNGTLTDAVFWKFLKEQKTTVLTGVPYSFEIMQKLRFTRMDLPDLKILSQGGGKLSQKLFEELANYAEQSGRKFIATYGQTEGTARMAYLPSQFAITKTGSIGIPIPNGELYLIDDNGARIDEEKTSGEMVYEGKNVTLGYAYVKNDLQKGDERNGILKTGDIAIKDKDGCFYIVGRKSRFLKLFGTRVSLDEMEQLISKEFQVETMCKGTDEKMLIYVTKENLESEVLAFVIKKTGLYHQAFKVEYLESLPRNEVGKILYY
jgi:long-chain acyl-CoA synthetase